MGNNNDSKDSGIKNFLQGILPFGNRQPATEQKSNPLVNAPFAFADFLGAAGLGDLQAIECIRLYKKCAPLFNAVNMRAEAFSSIPIHVYDKKAKTFVDQTHPILELLAKPNAMQSGSSFLKWYSSYFDICGEAFLIATGPQASNKGPLEILQASPASITVRPAMEWNTIGFPGSYFLSNPNGTANYELEERAEGFRYWNASKDQELWQAKEFNPSQSANNLRGLSKVSPSWLQIQQFIEADQNNYSILKRGGRPSIAWVWDGVEGMTDAQYQRMKEQVLAYEGAINAGRQVILDKMKLENIGMNNKDMEFAQNRKTVKEDIYGTFYIPLPLVSSSQMTLDNLATSTLMFYDMSVLPLTDNLYDELTRFLMPRYKGSENLCLKYNENDINVLKERAIARADKLAKLYVLTDNEVRTSIGYEKTSAGNEVYKPTNVAVPKDDSEPAPADPNNPAPEPVSSAARKQYVKQLRGMKSASGSGKRLFSDEAIEQMADDMGLK